MDQDLIITPAEQWHAYCMQFSNMNEFAYIYLITYLRRLPTFSVGSQHSWWADLLQHTTLTPPPGGQESMESEELSLRPHSRARGVEGSPCLSQMTTPPCPPVSPSRVIGRSSWQAGTQQLISPRHPSPSHTAPTWASVTRGGITARTRQAPSSTTPADVITLYRQCVAFGLLACFNVRNWAGYEEVNFCFRFPVSSNSSAPASPSRCRWHRGNHHTVATSFVDILTSPLEWPDEDRLLPPPQPPAPPSHPTAPSSPVWTPSLTVPPSLKKARKRRCELERVGHQLVAIALPSVALTTGTTLTSLTKPIVPYTASTASISTCITDARVDRGLTTSCGVLIPWTTASITWAANDLI